MKTIIIALLLIPVVAFAAGPPCGNVHKKRTVKGVEPTASALYYELKSIESGS
jgi:hypothetical protein